MSAASGAGTRPVVGPVIETVGLGIRFGRNRRQRLSMREMLFQRRTSTPKGSFWALRDVSLSVQQGEAVGLVGANGQGKSTLLRLIAGVLLPDEGTVAVRGGVAPSSSRPAGSSATSRPATTSG
ncbi:hypothetical protein GCM10025868_36480 [Angustibacter aerolatus]|uniref:ABC transporter domain-containing protein n=1 Tax=Angustibacter aerolatus TaxID=1162965 RepID=A0ABQ6JLY0_9ACTN|nr:ATP-binding cassette domain-containing protein [Angustibacter aerolatus]GMA88398.1 hypothetical protein GCM10025868_36480 [Angustibacter aerolatus]